MTDLVIAIRTYPVETNSGYRQAAPTFVALPQPTSDGSVSASPSKDLFSPTIEGVPLALPLPNMLAAASYQAQLPRLTYTYNATFDTPPTRRQPPSQQRVASAAQVYTRQLNMVVYKPGLLVDCYA